jgi:hypothetical protein
MILTVLLLNASAIFLTLKDYRRIGLILKVLADGISLVCICIQ